MVSPPFADSLGVLGVAEVVTIFGLFEPPALAVSLAGFLAFGLGAEFLAALVPGVGNKGVLAVLAFTIPDSRRHRLVPPKPKFAGEHRKERKKMEEEGRKD